MTYRTLAPLAVAAASLLGLACSDDSDDQAEVETRPIEDGSTTTVADAATSTTEASGTDEDGEESSDSSDGGSTQGSTTPRDQDLDIELRHPYAGLTVTVSGLRFEDRAIYVDAEMVNGSNVDGVTLYSGSTDRQLRLVDDAGTEYPYVPADEDEGDVALAPGESVSGGFAFRGPLADRPDRLYMITNMSSEDIASFDINEDTDRYYPAFVVPFDLDWG